MTHAAIREAYARLFWLMDKYPPDRRTAMQQLEITRQDAECARLQLLETIRKPYAKKA